MSSQNESSSSVQEPSSKLGQAPLAFVDMTVVALPNPTTEERPPDLTANMKFIDGKEATRADYYA